MGEEKFNQVSMNFTTGGTLESLLANKNKEAEEQKNLPVENVSKVDDRREGQEMQDYDIISESDAASQHDFNFEKVNAKDIKNIDQNQLIAY